MKILVFISKLHGGGAERVASLLINHLHIHHDIIVALFNTNEKSYHIDDKIEIIDLSKGKRIRPYQLNRIVKCRKAIKDVNPDIIISFLVGLNRFTVISNCFTRKKLILSEQTSIQAKQPLWEWLTRHTLYRFASKVVFVSKSDYEYAKWLKNRTFIYNPLSCSTITDNGKREKTIVAISSQRRWHVKGFDLLIYAWAKIKSLHPDWKLQFIGANDDNYICDLAKSCGLKNQVDFLGWTDDIDKVLRTKSIYVLSSRREGFPCSLLEAMSQGCSCVAFNCKTGPNEIITNGKSGLLARNGDVDDLAAKLQLLIEDENLRQLLSAGAVEEVKQFDKELIMKQWDKLIQLIIDDNPTCFQNGCS